MQIELEKEVTENSKKITGKKDIKGLMVFSYQS